MEYHWYYRAESAPPVLTSPEQLTDAECICISCTQTGLTRSNQNALVRRWCQRLPTLSHVKSVRLASKVPQVLFDAACQMSQLEDLWVKWSGNGITSIAAIQSMTTLRYFHLGSSTSLHSIEPLAKMGHLKWLGLENLKRIRSIDALANLTELEGLTLEGSMWNTWKVRSLAPLGALKSLRYLSLANLRSEDGTLAPLLNFSSLENLVVPTWWSHEEVREIRRRNPRLAA